ncbi:MAG: hypothetical protein GY754_16250 [bacterium]|nr:hypothetical protein [bacterium]
MDLNRIQEEYNNALETLRELNPNIAGRRKSDQLIVEMKRPHTLQKVLVVNRGEIAKRFFLALHEEGIPSVAVVTEVDNGQSWYEFADEVVFLGANENYTNIPMIIAAANLIKANALYAGYGFLSENPDFVESMERTRSIFDHEIIFMGPDHKTMRLMGDKVSARELAMDNDVPLFESSNAFPDADYPAAREASNKIGYPVIVKLSAGGGGKGMYTVYNDTELERAVESSCRIGRELYQNTSFYIEKYIEKPVHIEVQVFNGWAVGVRKCAVQRRNQKIIEESGHAFFPDYITLSLLAAAERIARFSGYINGCGAGTVEFLIDNETMKFGFLEMNTRLQVEYAVTDQSLGIDLAKWQILYYDGRADEIVDLNKLKYRATEIDHSIECRIYAEEPENDYLPSPGTIVELNLPTFNGIRCDFGFGEGDNIVPMYDPMIGKIVANGKTRQETLIRLERGLQELYIKGVKTNVNQLLQIIRHEAFIEGNYTNNLLPEHPELNFELVESDDDAPVERRANKHIIFGAFSEYVRLLHQSIREFMVIANVDGVIDAPVISRVPYKYTLEYKNREYTVEFLQVSLNSFYAFVNGMFNGTIILSSFNDRSDDLLIIFGNSSNRIRVDWYYGYIVLRMRDESNKINYYRMNVIPEGSEDQTDIGHLRSPFQGTFVSFARDDIAIGDSVKEGDPLVILSAMKMETTIYATIDGTINYIIEGGDLSRLQINKTSDGRIMGKALQEGELLVKIESVAEAEEQAAENSGSAEQKFSFPITEETLNILYRDNLEQMIVKNPKEHISRLGELLHASVLGFIQQPHIIEKLIGALEKILVKRWDVLINEPIAHIINAAVLHYTHIKRLFSPVVSTEGLSFPEELNLYVKSPEGELSSTFDSHMNSLLFSYGITEKRIRPEVKKMQEQHILLLFRYSYQFCLNYPELIENLVYVFVNLEQQVDGAFDTLKRLLENEQSELNDSLAKFIKNVISKNFPERSLQLYTDEEASAIMDSGTRFYDFVDEGAEMLHHIRDSITKPSKTLIPEDLDLWYTGNVRESLAILEKTYVMNRLFAPLENVLIFRADSREDETLNSYVAYSAIDFNNGSGKFDSLETVINCAASFVSAYQNQQIDKCTNNWIEIIVRGRVIAWDLDNPDDSCITYAELKDACFSALNFFYDNSLTKGIIDCEVRLTNSGTVKRKRLEFYQKNDAIVLDLLHDSDSNNPYCTQEGDARNQRLFNIEKWPVTFWAEECFDPGSFEEITIASIDNAENPVAANIFYGTINGKGACFYMKDSRIRGGSTGNLEGLKYVAAAYVAYLKGWPFYVWNDSAGANIKEGVVSLNRGAEGFMMNTLLSERVDFARFRLYTGNTSDPVLKNLFKELDEQFSFSDSPETFTGKPGPEFQLVVVGIGSSAGLDAYGASQASIQVLLDSEQSYRVLTGSNVIKSVIGEDISNYDIGGAKILGKWTGIVDIIADDKLHLLNSIHRLHRFFCSGAAASSAIKRIAPSGEQSESHDAIVLTESTIRANVDNGEFWPFKGEYYASGSLLGGFASLGGRRVLILGTRTNSGIRSFASIIKARELLKMAHRTLSHQILVFGKKWQRGPNYHENISMRSRYDLMNAVCREKGVRIHIITHAEGIKRFDINSSADVIIFIKNEDALPADIKFAEKNATLIVESFEEAFDLSLKLITLLDQQGAQMKAVVPSQKPNIPTDTGEPYDMIESVIKRVCDEDSFLEFFKEMNDPMAGPNLITGLARINGSTVGIIADQPLLKGGGADALGTEKFRVFTEIMNKKNIPILMLSNSSGFVPGSQQERFRIQAIGAESLDANILGEIPVVSVVLNQVYGGRLIHAFNKFLRPGIVNLALENAVMAVIGANAAFDLFSSKKYNELLQAGKTQEAEVLRDSFYSDFTEKCKVLNNAMNTGLIDWIVKDVGELREHIIKAMDLAVKRCKEAFE